MNKLHCLVGTVNFSNKYITQKLNSAGGLLVPEGIIRPVVSDSELGGLYPRGLIVHQQS
jgi:hypothetical protein